MRNISLSDLTVARSGEHTVISIDDTDRHFGPVVPHHYETALRLSAQGFSRRQVSCIMGLSEQEIWQMSTGNRPYPEILAMNATDLQPAGDHRAYSDELTEVDALIAVQTPKVRKSLSENPMVTARKRREAVQQRTQSKSASPRLQPASVTQDPHSVMMFAILNSDQPAHHSRHGDSHHHTPSHSPSPSYGSPSSYDSGSSDGGGGGGSSD